MIFSFQVQSRTETMKLDETVQHVLTGTLIFDAESEWCEAQQVGNVSLIVDSEQFADIETGAELEFCSTVQLGVVKA